MRRAFVNALLVGAIVLAATGCVPAKTTGSDTSQSIDTTVTLGAAATAKISDGNGNAATISIALGKPVTAATVTEAQACMVRLNGDLNHASALPIRVSGTITSGSPVDLIVELGNVKSLAAEDGSVTLAGPTEWSVKYGQTPWECDPGNNPVPATVEWPNASPRQAHSWTAWLVVPDAVTGSDPSGAQAVGSLVLQPLVRMGTQTFVAEFDATNSSIVQCAQSDPAAGTTGYVALDASVAKDHGCQANAEGAAQQAQDKICRTAFPVIDSNTTTVGAVTTFGRQASRFQVCAGFGHSENRFTWTQAMKCTVIGLAASYVGAQVPTLNTAKSLCSVEDVMQQLSGGKWLDSAGQQACDWYADVFSTQLGVAAAAVVTASAPVAIAIGVAAAGALKAGLGEACGGNLLQDFRNLGAQLENKHLGDVAHDVMAGGKCIQQNAKPQVLRGQWSAVTCSMN